jgi:leader peptidase (prepilin peptidase) / N-methyltransferase
MLLFAVFFLGLAVGSFLNVLILRIPMAEPVVFAHSRCLCCNTPLKMHHNVPLLSWIFLRGKCAFCKTKISLQYPLIELLSGLLFVGIALKMGIGLLALFAALTFSMLLVLCVIDFRYKMVPDSINLLALLFAVLAAYSPHMLLLNLQNALLFAGGFTLLRFVLSYLLTARERSKTANGRTVWTKNYQTFPFIEAMGEADILIAATMGALLGVKLALFAVFLSAVLALPVMLLLLGRSTEEQKVPFIPFLALATLITYLFDSSIYMFLEKLYG